MKYILGILLVISFVSCEQSTEDKTQDNSEVLVSLENESPSNGGATESWGMIIYERTYPPYFEQYVNNNPSQMYKLEFYPSQYQKNANVEISELEVYSKTISLQSPNDKNSVKAINNYPLFIKRDFFSGWEELNDGKLNTHTYDIAHGNSPAVINIDFNTAINIDRIKISFHQSDLTKKLANKMVLYKNILGLGWVKIYEVLNLSDERFDDLVLNELTTFEITGASTCENGLFPDNNNICRPNRVICSDLANAFTTPANVPCEVLMNNETIDCIAASNAINCNDSITSNLCEEYSQYLDSSNSFLQVRSSLSNILRTVKCN